jgi:hypothetical protein
MHARRITVILCQIGPLIVGHFMLTMNKIEHIHLREQVHHKLTFSAEFVICSKDCIFSNPMAISGSMDSLSNYADY